MPNMLTGPEIKKQIERKAIEVDPYNPECIGCYSYDIHLSDKIKTHANQFMRDVRDKWRLTTRSFGAEGLLLQPDQVYIGESVESLCSSKFSARVSSLLSLAKHGIQLVGSPYLHAIGHKSKIILCISTVEPVVIYPKMRIAQVWFGPLEGEVAEYNGRYKNQKEMVESKFYTDFTGR